MAHGFDCLREFSTSSLVASTGSTARGVVGSWLVARWLAHGVVPRWLARGVVAERSEELEERHVKIEK